MKIEVSQQIIPALIDHRKKKGEGEREEAEREGTRS